MLTKKSRCPRLLSACLRGMALILLLCLPLQAVYADTIRIALRAHSGAARDMAKWQPTADYLSSQIPGHQFVMVPFEDLVELTSAVGHSDFDFVLTNPANYIELEMKYGASRIATLQNLRHGAAYTQYGAVIFTRADRQDIQELTDLKGKTFMAVSPTAMGGWRMAWRTLQQNDLDPSRDFAALKFSGGIQEEVVHAVLRGDVDAGTVRTDMLEGMARNGEIDLHNIRLVHTVKAEGFPFMLSTELYPEWPFAKLKPTSVDLAKQVAIALLAMRRDQPAALSGQYVGWTVPLDYQPVHDLLKALRVGPYQLYGSFSWADVWHRYWPWFITATFVAFAAWLAVIYVFRINQHLRKVQRELQTARDTLEQRVQARTEELETAKDVAEKASHAKSEFLSRMSHELRTPMNAILGFAQLMEYGNNPPLPESHQSNVREILLAGNHLLALINDVLDLATIESGRLQLDMKTLDIRDTLEEVQRIIQPLAECEQISLTLESCKQGECTVVVDSTRLKQVLINLLSNAVKYNHPGGSVTLSCLRNEKDQVLLTIEDTGIGIAKHQLEKIFDPFVRLDSNTHIEGTGIGLSVTKQLVEAMGGTIEVDSQVGKGTRFRITLDAANETTT